MKLRSAIRLYALTAALLGLAAPARAQFSPRPVPQDKDQNRPPAERFWIEGAFGFWMPSPDMSISSENLGIIGSTIDFQDDLGLESTRFREMHLTLSPGPGHKLRFQYIPIKYTQTTTLSRTITFNGQAFRVNLPIESELDWKAYRFGYEWDFLRLPRGYGGFVLDFKQTDVKAELTNQLVSEFVHVQAPIPAIGGTFRVYPTREFSFTGEITGFKLPDSLIEDASGHYVDMDFYGTYNFTRNIGAQMGYRSLDVGYVVDTDLGSFRLKGLYFGVIARY